MSQLVFSIIIAYFCNRYFPVFSTVDRGPAWQAAIALYLIGSIFLGVSKHANAEKLKALRSSDGPASGVSREAMVVFAALVFGWCLVILAVKIWLYLPLFGYVASFIGSSAYTAIMKPNPTYGPQINSTITVAQTLCDKFAAGPGFLIAVVLFCFCLYVVSGLR